MTEIKTAMSLEWVSKVSPISTTKKLQPFVVPAGAASLPRLHSLHTQAPLCPLSSLFLSKSSTEGASMALLLYLNPEYDTHPCPNTGFSSLFCSVEERSPLLAGCQASGNTERLHCWHIQPYCEWDQLCSHFTANQCNN